MYIYIYIYIMYIHIHTLYIYIYTYTYIEHVVNFDNDLVKTRNRVCDARAGGS